LIAQDVSDVGMLCQPFFDVRGTSGLQGREEVVERSADTLGLLGALLVTECHGRREIVSRALLRHGGL
jgi:hypothetical protein